jgi:hypothetical protein
MCGLVKLLEDLKSNFVTLPAMNVRIKLEDPLTIRFHLTDGTTHAFSQTNTAINEKLWDEIDPSRLFARPRIVVGSEHSKSVFVAAEIIRVDFHHDSFQCWKFPGGYSDIVEVSEEEFRTGAWLDEPSLRTKRDRPMVPGDLLLSFVKLQMRGGQPLFAKVKALAKLPAESQSFMQFLLSKAAVHMRLRGRGIGVVNLANLVGYTVHPGVAQIPADSWLAEPISEPVHSTASNRL